MITRRSFPPKPIGSDAVDELRSQAGGIVQHGIEQRVIPKHERQSGERRVVPVRNIVNIQPSCSEQMRGAGL